MTQYLGIVFAEAGSILLEGHAYGHGKFVHCSSTVTYYIMHALAMVLTDLNCGDSARGIMIIFNVRCL